MLATAEFVALPMPEGCDVPVGALNHTGVMSKRNELTRFATSYYLLTYPEGCSGAGGVQLTCLPPLLITALAY